MVDIGRITERAQRMRNGIPNEMKAFAQWVLWKKVERDGRPTKAPFQSDRTRATVDDPQSWAGFDEILAAYVSGRGYFDGIGFVFTNDDPFLGVDLDGCVIDGKLMDSARNILIGLDSYSERSQSRSGVHVIVMARKPGDRCKSGQIGGFKELEMYDHERFFIMTGDHIGGTPGGVMERQEPADKLYKWAFRERAAGSRRAIQPASATLSDEEIIELLCNARNGDKFKRLYYGGDMRDYGNDWSRADQGLVNMIAFYSQNVEQIDRIFRNGALLREKWSKREKYREMTINRALEGLGSRYRKITQRTANPQG